MNINIFHFSDLSSTAFILPMQTIDVWFFKTEDFPPDAQDTQILSIRRTGTGLPVIHR